MNHFLFPESSRRPHLRASPRLFFERLRRVTGGRVSPLQGCVQEAARAPRRVWAGRNQQSGSGLKEEQLRHPSPTRRNNLLVTPTSGRLDKRLFTVTDGRSFLNGRYVGKPLKCLELQGFPPPKKKTNPQIFLQLMTHCFVVKVLESHIHH